MPTTDSLEPDPANPVISVSTTEVGTTSTPTVSASSPLTQTGEPEAPLPTASSNPSEEAPIWEERYAMGNFAGRFLWGTAFLLGWAVLGYIGYYQERVMFHPLAILWGIVTLGFWAWLLFRIVRARLSHQYQLTSHRLFVSQGIFRRRRDMMELTNLKEVTLQQQKFLDHIFHIGTVVVTSNVGGAPTLFLSGVKDPQKVMDLIYHHARD